MIAVPPTIPDRDTDGDQAVLALAFAAASPRVAPPPTPLLSVAIHGGAVLLFVALASRAFAASGVLAWSVGFAYIAYDTVLSAIVFRQTLALLRPVPPRRPTGPRATLGIVVAAFN